ncbi:MAG: TatD family hydrolase, partial [Acidobacteriaceae bacterium]|nr:TatD family hydrolase [Acidobacteriaceae bacterium]
HRGKRNEPAFLTHTAATIAAVRNDSPEQLARETTANFKSIFGRKIN